MLQNRPSQFPEIHLFCCDFRALEYISPPNKSDIQVYTSAQDPGNPTCPSRQLRVTGRYTEVRKIPEVAQKSGISAILRTSVYLNVNHSERKMEVKIIIIIIILYLRASVRPPGCPGLSRFPCTGLNITAQAGIQNLALFD